MRTRTGAAQRRKAAYNGLVIRSIADMTLPQRSKATEPQ